MYYITLIPFTLYFIYFLYKNVSKKTVFNFIKRFPPLKNKIDNKINQEIQSLQHSLEKDRFKYQNPNEKIITTLQMHPLSPDEIQNRINSVTKYYKPDNKISGAIYANDSYQSNKIFLDFIGNIYAKTAYLNPTHHTVWPHLTQIEMELYTQISNLFYVNYGNNENNGSKETNCVLTSGGTMSNIEAMYAYRNYANQARNITKPNIIAPSSAHASFRKACQILQIEYCQVPTNGETGKADYKKMEELIDKNTIALIASAPSFPYGIIDPLERLSSIAIYHDIPLHLDACLGGFMTAFLENLSEKCDFRTLGITSISADLHKFGQTPKGISILMFRDNKYKKYLTYTDMKWSGGLYIVPDFPGSRPGASIILSWAILNSLGYEYYQSVAKQLIVLKNEIMIQIKIKFDKRELYIHGNPELSTFGLKSNIYNIHYINKKMTEYGWEFNSLPDGLHFCLTPKHLLCTNFASIFIDDLLKTISYIKEHLEEDPGQMAQIYCSTQNIPDYAEDIMEDIGRMYINVQSRYQKN